MNENLSAFFRGYVGCALWSSVDDDGEPLDAEFSEDDVSEEAREAMRRECADFMAYAAEDLESYASERDWEHAGHDFWLTRNGHGAGFWDRGLGELGERLTKSAKTFGGSDLYIGDDGAIHLQ